MDFFVLFYTHFSVDYAQEQEMEIEALEAILMDDITGLSVSGLLFFLFFILLASGFRLCSTCSRIISSVFV